MSEPQAKKQKIQYKKKFYQPKKKKFLEVGHRGFLATCNFNEKDCIRECYKILNQHANEMYGIEEDQGENGNDQDCEEVHRNIEETSNDIADELQQQINATHGKGKTFTKRRFQVVDTGASNCVFIKTTLDDPKPIAESIVNDIMAAKQQKPRHLLRLLPICAVCKANEKDIVNAAGQLCDTFFLKDHTTFSIVFKKRFNNNIDRMELIDNIASLIQTKNVKNKVDLKNAKRSLVIEVIKGLCCLTVVDDYLAKRKYNLYELANSNQQCNLNDDKIKDIEDNEEKSNAACNSNQIDS